MSYTYQFKTFLPFSIEIPQASGITILNALKIPEYKPRLVSSQFFATNEPDAVLSCSKIDQNHPSKLKKTLENGPEWVEKSGFVRCHHRGR